MTEIEYINKLCKIGEFEKDLYFQSGIRLSQDQIINKLKEENIYDVFMSKKIKEKRKKKLKNIIN